MPQFDLPLKALQAYGGENPCPKDFDRYWEKALQELDAQSTQYTLEPDLAVSIPGITYSHLWFTGVGGARIHAKFLMPTGKKNCPAALVFHGYHGSSGDWFRLLPFAQSGIAVAALDVRGQAGESEDNLQVSGNTVKGHIIRGAYEDDPHKLFFRNVFLDTAQLARIVSGMDNIDSARVSSIGFSQGGALAFVCSALSGLTYRTFSGYPFLCDYARVWNMDLPTAAYEELYRHFRLKDPMHKKEAAFFEKLGYIDIQFLAQRIQTPVRFFTGLQDNVCPPSSQFAAYNRLTCPKDMVLYPDFGHEDLPEAWQNILLSLLEDSAK